MERRSPDEKLKLNLAGHTIDPDSLLPGVLCFDHHAAGRKIILVSHCLIAHVHKVLW